MVAVCLYSYCMGRGCWLAQSTDWRSITSQKPRKSSEKSLRSLGKSCWCSSPLKRKNTGLLLIWGREVAFGIYAGVIVCVSNSTSLTLESHNVFIFEKFFKSFSGTAFSLGSGFTVFQIATSETITYLWTLYKSMLVPKGPLKVDQKLMKMTLKVY